MSLSPTRSRPGLALAVGVLAMSLIGACGAGETPAAPAGTAAAAGSASGVATAKESMAGWAQGKLSGKPFDRRGR